MILLLSKYGRFHAVAVLFTFCVLLLLLLLLTVILLLLLCCDIIILIMLLAALLFLTLSYFMWVVDFLQPKQDLHIC